MKKSQRTQPPSKSTDKPSKSVMGKLMSKHRRRYSANTTFSDAPILKSTLAMGKSNSADYGMMRKSKEKSRSFTGNLNAIQCHTDEVTTVATIQPTLCISGSKDKTIVVQNFDIGCIIRKWEEHTREITKVQCNNNLVASASRDLNIKIWSIEQQQSLGTMQAHKLVVTAVDFNHDNTKLCSGSRDNSIKIWDVARNEVISDTVLSRNLVTDMRWLKGESLIVQTAEDKVVKLWDARNLELVHSFPPQGQIQTCCDLNGYYCITGNNGFSGQGCQINLWDLRQKEKLHEYRGHTESVTGCTFVESVTSTRFFASCSHDGTVRLWQENNQHPTSCEQLNVGSLTSIACLSKDTLVCGSFEQGIRVIRRGVSERLAAV